MPAASGCTAPTEPDRDQVPDIIAVMVDDWILSARATYGSVYSDPNYKYSITSFRRSGTTANVAVAYSGSVREILSGARQSASGAAQVRLVGSGFGWGVTSVEY